MNGIHQLISTDQYQFIFHTYLSIGVLGGCLFVIFGHVFCRKQRTGGAES